jgi:hypothetical protein
MLLLPLLLLLLLLPLCLLQNLRCELAVDSIS